MSLLESIQSQWDRLSSRESMDGDVLWSGLLEAHGVTKSRIRGVLPAFKPQGKNYTALGIGTPITLNRDEWMTAAFQVQQQLGVWKKYTFWDPSTLKPQQKLAMECEGKYEPDCSSNDDDETLTSSLNTHCRPNAEHCWPDFGDTLDAMSKQ